MPGLPVVIPTLRIRPWRQHLPAPAHELALISLLSTSFTPSICVSPPQISSHVKAIDAIYQGTDFMGIRNISFMVKRIRVSLALLSLYFSPFLPVWSLQPVATVCRLRLVSLSPPAVADQHHHRREGPLQPLPIPQHRRGEVPGAQLGAEPRRLLPGLRLHRPRLRRRRAWPGLGRRPLR